MIYIKSQTHKCHLLRVRTCYTFSHGLQSQVNDIYLGLCYIGVHWVLGFEYFLDLLLRTTKNKDRTEL